MSVIETIRVLDGEGVSGREIARRTGVNRETVAKYTKEESFSPAAPVTAREPGRTALLGLTTIIEGWLADDERRPRKQRHTAKRVYDRLCAEHDYAGSYSPVQRFIQQYRRARRTGSDGYLELAWPAGQAQVDFGEAEALIGGIRTLLHIFIVTFPFSNMRFVQAYRGETAECVCDGLRRVFEYIGVVPRLLVFDNATGIGRRTGKTIIESKLFAQFRQHYRLEARFCNPYSGNEKGNVENAVGFLRRNLMVPEPDAPSLAELNATFLSQCVELGGQKHWRKETLISELFVEDVAAGLELPGVAFDAVRYESRKADKTGTVLIDGNSYLAGPTFAGRLITVGLRHDVVELLDEHAHPVVTFERVFGSATTTQFQAVSLLPALGAKPGAWSHSLARPEIPEPLRGWLDAASLEQRARVFWQLFRLSEQTTFHTAIEAASRLVARGDTPVGAGVEMLARRILQGSEPEPHPVNLNVYDQLSNSQPDQAAGRIPHEVPAPRDELDERKAA